MPSDLAQVRVVWGYEMLKYLRSRRLLASIAIVVAILGLIYALPPLVGTPYKGSEARAPVDVMPMGLSYGPFNVTAFGSLRSGVIDEASLEVFRDGVPYPSGDGANWVFVDKLSANGQVLGSNLLLFTQNVTGSVITASYEWHMPVQDFETTFMNFGTLLVVICGTFFGADSIVGEFQNRTGYLMFPNPMRRSSLFMGKYLASMTAGLLVLGLFYIGVGALSLLTLGAVDDDFGTSFAFAAEYLFAVMAVAYLISSLLKGSTGALVLTFFMFIMILPIVDSVSMFAGVKISASLTFSGDVMVYALSDPYPKDVVNTDYGVTLHQYYPDPELSALVMAVYALVAAGLSMLLFKRKQLAG